ncbi:MAG: hypothetical protein KAJ86_06205 [Alphaproteobacteria bacterium]|nr:hypothetical protein [Alphaproteobacteria bacterium]
MPDHTGMIGGALIDYLKVERWVEPFVFQINVPKDSIEETKQTAKQRLNYAWGETKDILRIRS